MMVGITLIASGLCLLWLSVFVLSVLGVCVKYLALYAIYRATGGHRPLRWYLHHT